MKTAISIPDELFEKGEATAQQLEISRSQLYSRALEQYLARRDRTEVKRRLQEYYSSEPSALDPVLHEMQIASIEREGERESK